MPSIIRPARIEEDRLKPLFLLALTLLLLPGVSQAYVGPGAGFGVATSFLAVLNAVALSLLSLLIWPFASARRALLRSRIPRRPFAKRVVVLGLDGLSPAVAARLIAGGRMPRLAALARSGILAELATTTPGISPVAWTTFQTGVDPGKHGIFDFLAPDRARYAPVLSSVETARTRRGRDVIRSLRGSRPFWELLGAFGLRSVVLRVPVTYPPGPLDGYLLSGMCVPDLRGTQGLYSLLNGRRGELPGGIEAELSPDGRRRWRASLEGPPSGYHPLGIELAERSGKWSARIGSGTRVRLEPGVLTGWVGLSFRSRGRGPSARGVARLCLTPGDSPALYVSAIHPDPWSPPFPISYPVLYSRYLTSTSPSGSYATLGLAEDTWALMNGALTERQFLSQAWSIFEERRGMFRDALRRVKRGLAVCVFDTPDRIQHVCWAAGDAPGTPVGDMYERMDALIGETADALGPDDMLIVMSDHGFASFDTCVDLNRFLFESGFLVFRDGLEPPLEDLSGVDWSRTRAYSLGLAGIMLNIKGRESQGIVEPGGEAASIMDDIAGRLLGLEAPDGRRPVKSVTSASDAYHGPYVGRAPDLVVGTGPGFRSSWHSVTGGTGTSTVHPNPYRWTGDHCHDSSLVPGILASGAKLTGPASIRDIAPTVMRALGLDAPPHMDGRSLLEEVSR